MYLDVVEKLKSLITPGILQLYAYIIFFAVCIHTIECWLLPIYFTNHHQSDTRNCITTLNKELGKQKLDVLAQGNKNNAISIRAYDSILKNWKKQQDVISAAQHNFGFKQFVESISVIDGQQ